MPKALEVAGCIIHTDRGSPFGSGRFVHDLNHHAMIGSMARAGLAGDNAASESFFPRLNWNVLHRRTWATRRRAAGSQ